MAEDINSEWVFRGNILTVRVDSLPRPGGASRREVVETAEVSAVLALRERGGTRQICLVEQYRHPTGRRMREIPAGRVDPDETPEECARREFAEETGYAARRWSRMGSFFSSPGFCTELIHVFFAEDLVRAEDPPKGDEQDVQVLWSPLADLFDRKDAAELDAKTLAALALWMGASA